MARKVVFDTNVLISGYLWQGAPRRALERVRAGQWTLLSSRETMEEFIRVLAYEKFGLEPAEIAPLIADLQQISVFVEAGSEIGEINEDPTDNIFLSLAVDGKAEVIVSGDRHLLRLKEFQDIRIFSVNHTLREE